MGVRIITGHVLEALRGMAAESVNTVVTSPPYYLGTVSAITGSSRREDDAGLFAEVAE